MATLSSKLVVSLLDRASGPARRIASAIGGIRTASRSMSFGAQMMRETKRFRRAASAATVGVSAPIGMMASFGARAAFNFEKAMNKMQAFGQISDGQRKSMEDHTKSLNKMFPFTNQQIAQAAGELFKAGLKFEQVRGTLKDTLSLAQAGDIGLGESADIATNVLTAMRLPMQTEKQASESLKRVADNLAYAAVSSNTDVRMMGQTFKYVAPLAAAAGMEIEKVSAMAMLMANNGIKASEAGVAMRSALVRMVKPTKNMLAATERLGINIGDFTKGGRDVTSSDILSGLSVSGIDASSAKKRIDTILSDTVLQQKPAQLIAKLTNEISSTLGSSSVVDKEALSKSITDSVTVAAGNVDLLGFVRALREKGASLPEITRIFDAKQGARLITLLVGDLDKLSADVKSKSKNVAERMGKIMMKGIVGATARLKAAWENIWITIAKAGIMDQVSKAFDTIANAINKLSETNPKLLKFGVYAVGALAVLGPLGLIIGGVASSFTLLASAAKIAGLAVAFVGRGLLAAPFVAMRNPVVALRAAFTGLAGVLGAISWPVLLGVTAITTVIAAWDELFWFFKGFFGSIDEEFSKAGLGKPFETIGNAISSVTTAVKDLFGWLGRLFGINTGDDGERMASWFQAGRDAARSFANAVKGLINALSQLSLSKFVSDPKSILPYLGIVKKAPGRAKGGPVTRGNSYVVGEKGPELFSPSRSGIIIPNGAATSRNISVGNIHVHVQGGAHQNAHQLGAEIGRQVVLSLDEYLSDGGQ